MTSGTHPDETDRDVNRALGQQPVARHEHDEEHPMKLLKIGDRYINLDQVVGFDTQPQARTVQVYFVESTAVSPALERLALYSGDEAAALRRWIDANAEDIAKPRR